ncbi:T-cell surface antigen CD2 [Engystomops pustulosus]|uniref:T-cell surface antigen CD2 n=1 Tax=Engystomops pustulosus TaxID=76066 RepID=UPI003AFB395E
MVSQSAWRVFSLTRLCFILLLSGTAVTKDSVIYTAPERTVALNIPACSVSDDNTVEWETNNTRLAKWFVMKPQLYDFCNSSCILYKNGSLIIPSPKEKNSQYTVKVFNRNGSAKCTKLLEVVVQDILEQPMLEYNCSGKTTSIICSSDASRPFNLTLYYNSKTETTSENRKIFINTKEQKVEVTCSISNRVSASRTTHSIRCIVWDIYLIVSIAGGSVAFIIFIALVFYTVKYKPWRSHTSRDDVEVSGLQNHPVPRQLPQPPAICPEQGDPAEPGAVLPPHRHEAQGSGGRKGKTTKSQRLPPQAPGETALMYQQKTPALPGNHPNEQPPRPQPRGKSKAPRQQRKHHN